MGYRDREKITKWVPYASTDAAVERKNTYSHAHVVICCPMEVVDVHHALLCVTTAKICETQDPRTDPRWNHVTAQTKSPEAAIAEGRCSTRYMSATGTHGSTKETHKHAQSMDTKNHRCYHEEVDPEAGADVL